MVKKLTPVSLIFFILLLCPSQPLYLAAFLIGAIIFIVKFLKEGTYKSAKLDTTALLGSIILNLILSVIFIHRWGTIAGTYPALLMAVLFAFAGAPALPCLLSSVRVIPLGKELYPTKLSVSEIIIALIASVGVLLFSSHSSPLVAFNDYCDANCMFTIGRGLVKGKVAYKDLIDQKGPMILYIHALGALISFKTYLGVWLLECIACFISVIFGIKIHHLLSPKRGLITKILIFALTFALYSSNSFFYGDSAESYSIPAILGSVYLLIRSFIDNKLSFKRCLLIGLGIGYIFWIKYTLCGTFVGLALFVLIMCLRNKDFKKLLGAIGGIIAGMAIVSLPIIILFTCQNALNYLVKVYFIDNIFNYNMGGGSEDPISKIIMPFNMLCSFMSENFPLFILTVAGQLFMWKKNRRLSLMTILSFITCFTFAFISSKSYSYYSFILTTFAILGWTAAISLADYLIAGINKTAVKTALISAATVAICAMALPQSPNLKSVGGDISGSPVYGCSQIIKQSDNPTLMCYGFLDRGFYTYNDIIPDVPYFTYLNSNTEFIMQEQERYINEGNYEFIITECQPHDFEGYELIYMDPNLGEGMTYFLYQRVDN